MSSLSVEESIDRAVRYVSEGWLPPQSEVLEKLRSRLKDGEYANDRSQLTKDLKADFSLYMYCLRELTVCIEKAGIGPQSQPAPVCRKTPAEIFAAASLDDFKKIIERSENEISRHSLKEMNELQALRFRESIISASTAEVLAESAKVNPEVGFSCGLLRQLGLTLIAWNYPRIYARAIETLEPDGSLDSALRKVLGFSPTLLGVTFARRWNLSTDILAALGDKKAASLAAASLSSEANTIGETLAQICEIGEALARANDPLHYPTALADWQTAEQTIVKRLGPDGVRIVVERSRAHLREYVKYTPELLNFSDSATVKEQIVGTQYSARLLEKNPYIRSLPPELQSSLRKLYSRFKPNKILKSNIRMLMSEILPQAGLAKGAAFLFDPESKTLTPAITLGELAQERLRPVRLSSTLSQFDIVASAFSLKAPLREESTSAAKRRVTILAGALGTSSPVGVLYLESKEDFVVDNTFEPVSLFKALRQAFNDCLNLL